MRTIVSVGRESRRAHRFWAEPKQFTYGPTRTISVNEANTFEMTDVMTGNMVLDLQGGIDGDSGIIWVRQDLTGDRLVSITASGRTRQMTANLSTLNTTEMKIANTISGITFSFQTVGGLAVVELGIVPFIAAVFT